MSTDARIIRTRTNIKNSFMQLAESKPKEKISVSDIAISAGINRSTFYLHYGDVSDVATDIERDITNEISEAIKRFDITDTYGSILKIFGRFTEILEKHTAMKNYIVFSTNSKNVAYRLKEIMIEKVMSAICADFPAVNANDALFAVTYAISGIMDSYIGWVRYPNNKKSLESLITDVSTYTDYIFKLITETK